MGLTALKLARINLLSEQYKKFSWISFQSTQTSVKTLRSVEVRDGEDSGERIKIDTRLRSSGKKKESNGRSKENRKMQRSELQVKRERGDKMADGMRKVTEFG